MRYRTRTYYTDAQKPLMWEPKQTTLPGIVRFVQSAANWPRTEPLDANDERTLMKQTSLALRAAERSGMNQVRGAEAPSKTVVERSPA